MEHRATAYSIGGIALAVALFLASTVYLKTQSDIDSLRSQEIMLVAEVSALQTQHADDLAAKQNDELRISGIEHTVYKLGPNQGSGG